MSNNDFPQPPKLSSAKELMDAQKAVAAPAPVEPVKDEETTTSIQTPVAPQPEVALVTEPESVEDSSESVETVEAAVDKVEETIQSETTEGESDKTPAEPVKEFGPWEIVKHTGIVTTVVSGVVTAAITGAVAFFFAPGHYTWITLGILGFMMGALAAIDRKTHRIKDQHTILTAILTVPLSVLVAFSLSPWNLLYGVIGAFLVLVVLLAIAIFLPLGVGGGDLKFCPIPAFALGVLSPLAPFLWMFFALIVTGVLLVVRGKSSGEGKKKRTSFGEGMAISLPLTLLAVYGLYTLMNMPYMHAA